MVIVDAPFCPGYFVILMFVGLRAHLHQMSCHITFVLVFISLLFVFKCHFVSFRSKIFSMSFRWNVVLLFVLKFIHVKYVSCLIFLCVTFCLYLNGVRMLNLFVFKNSSCLKIDRINIVSYFISWLVLVLFFLCYFTINLYFFYFLLLSLF